MKVLLPEDLGVILQMEDAKNLHEVAATALQIDKHLGWL